ncbi:hypothetical protein KBC85_00855 [Candidatus Saccharibacteria bacterium]|nr:hypothetical protein [Candidatus Saccharibacteria bacterium]MDQ5885352.1 hypothetical protein [Patescibacteria group bacterium]MDQ5953692.1 hypothetical protein [Patescibacteria group bacterium]MDQ5958263.1 hypothetical protein [Patescibacteria group bacterium]
MIKRKNLKTYIFCSALLVVLVIYAAPIFASSPTVTQGYSSDELLQRGMLVGLKNDDPRKVEPVNSDQADQLHGVIIGANESAVLLGSDEEKVYVASGGRFPVLVSSQNGPIKIGDYISPSAIKGIGMNAGKNNDIVIGKALEEFDASNQSTVKSVITVNDASDNEQQLSVGMIIVDIAVGKNPLMKNNTSLPEALRKSAETVAGKPVNATKVYISLFIIIVTSAIAGSIIYSAVRGGMVSIGRNPLGKNAIMRGLLQVVLVGMLILLSGFFGVYLILKL